MSEEVEFVNQYSERSFGYIGASGINKLVHKWVFGRTGDAPKYSDSDEFVGSLVSALCETGITFTWWRGQRGEHCISSGSGYDVFAESADAMPMVLCRVLLVLSWRRVMSELKEKKE